MNPWCTCLRHCTKSEALKSRYLCCTYHRRYTHCHHCMAPRPSACSCNQSIGCTNRPCKNYHRHTCKQYRHKSCPNIHPQAYKRYRRCTKIRKTRCDSTWPLRCRRSLWCTHCRLHTYSPARRTFCPCTCPKAYTTFRRRTRHRPCSYGNSP